MQISLILSDESGSYSTILGQFLETAVADTLSDRLLAQEAAVAAANSATDSDSSASQAATSASNAASSATSAASSANAASNSAISAAGSQTTAATNASNANTYAGMASSSATAAANSATAASGSATAAAGSATSAANSASAASTTLANALTKANNLSDVASATTALANIGGAALAGNSTQTFNVGTATTASQATPLSQVQTLNQEYTVFLPTNTTQTLTSAVLGGVVYWYSATGGTLTLQQGSGTFQGAKLKLVNGNTGAVVVSTFSGDTMSINGTTFTTITLGPGDDLDLVRADTATRWDVVGGSARASLVPLRVATATLTTQAINLGQAGTTYAALAGLATQAFNVGPATVAANAVQRQQISSAEVSGTGTNTATATYSFTPPVSGKILVIATGGSTANQPVFSVSTATGTTLTGGNNSASGNLAQAQYIGSVTAATAVTITLGLTATSATVNIYALFIYLPN